MTLLGLLLHGCDAAPPSGELVVTSASQMVAAATVTATFDAAVQPTLCCTGDVESLVAETHVWTAPSPDKVHVWDLRGLLAGETYTCAARDAAGADLVEPAIFTTEPLPEDLAAHVLTLDSWAWGAEDGWTLLGPFSTLPDGGLGTYLVVVDMEARIRWYWSVPEADGVIAFDHSDTHDAFWTGGGHKAVVPPRVLDLDGGVAYETSTQANHDVEWLDDASVGLVQGPGGFCIEERAWADDTLIGTLCADQLGYAGQLQGANSLDAVREDDGRVYYYVTLTDIGRILKIDREAAQVVWTFGNDGVFDGVPELGWLHDVNRVDCAPEECLFFYDNGTLDSGSQAVLWALDGAAGTAREVRSWSETGWFEKSLGGVQLLEGGNWLVGRGHNEAEDPDSPLTTVVELDPDDEIVWQLTLAPEDSATYRARRVPACDLFSHAGYCPSMR